MQTSLTKTEELAGADLMVLFLRFRPDEPHSSAFSTISNRETGAFERRPMHSGLLESPTRDGAGRPHLHPKRRRIDAGT